MPGHKPDRDGPMLPRTVADQGVTLSRHEDEDGPVARVGQRLNLEGKTPRGRLGDSIQVGLEIIHGLSL